MALNLRLSLSLDLDNTWSYLMIHGDQNWKQHSSHFPKFFPVVFEFLKSHNLHVTFFIVGKDAENKENSHWFQNMIENGHDVANHSYKHEPWMQKESEEKIIEEIQRAHDAISEATGKEPIGFRGPGFCKSPELLSALTKMNYRYDASLLATSLGPLARLYYLLSYKKQAPEENKKRDVLFGSFSNAFLPNIPFFWKTGHGKILEVPVTTMPLLRTPIHLSYLIWLSQFSKSLAWTYLKMSIALCKKCSIEPSLLLHPPDFMGSHDLPELSFFPGMNLSRSTKLEFMHEVFDELKKTFTLITLNEHALSLEQNPQNLKERTLLHG